MGIGGLSSREMAMKHVLISGTGRCGTTFLIALLSRLGLDTGFTGSEVLSETCRAGLERGPGHLDEWPYIVKCTMILLFAGGAVDVVLDRVAHLIIPMRDVEAAADSRRACQLRGGAMTPGGLGSMPNNGLEDVLMKQHYHLSLAASQREIPIVHLHYPRLILDVDYLHRLLEPVLPLGGVSEFRTVFATTRNDDWVRSYNDRDVWRLP